MAKINARRHTDTEAARAAYLAQADKVVESSRAMPAAKADAYRAKYDDACGIMSGNKSSGWVAAEAVASGESEQVVAESIIASRAAWEAAGAAVEAKRVSAKASVRKASTPREMHAIIESLQSSL